MREVGAMKSYAVAEEAGHQVGEVDGGVDADRGEGGGGVDGRGKGGGRFDLELEG